MSWYQALLNLDGSGNKFATEGAPFVFFDSRSLGQLHAALWTQGHIEVERASTGAHPESRGMAILRDPHVIAIEQRLDLEIRAPSGPTPFSTGDLLSDLPLTVAAE